MGLYEMMAGTLILSILDWLQKNINTVSIFIGIYLLLIFLARYQDRRIERNTNRLIANTIMELSKSGRGVTPSHVEKQMKPVWLKESKKWVLFVLGKRGLFPVIYKPENNFQKYVSKEKIDSFITASKK